MDQSAPPRFQKLEIVCPRCNIPGRVDRALIGRAVDCPRCRYSFIVLPADGAGDEMSHRRAERFS